MEQFLTMLGAGTAGAVLSQLLRMLIEHSFRKDLERLKSDLHVIADHLSFEQEGRRARVNRLREVYSELAQALFSLIRAVIEHDHVSRIQGESDELREQVKARGEAFLRFIEESQHAAARVRLADSDNTRCEKLNQFLLEMRRVMEATVQAKMEGKSFDAAAGFKPIHREFTAWLGELAGDFDRMESGEPSQAPSLATGYNEGSAVPQ